MQTIILAAGRGTRLGELTQNIPKPLTKILGKPILEYTLSSLPTPITEVLIVTGYLGEKIKETFGSSHNDLKIKYIPIAHLLGTAYALWQTRPLLNDEKFLVLNGDDIYDKKELGNMIKSSSEINWAFGLAKTIPPRPTYLNIQIDSEDNITGARYPNENEMRDGILMATGAYILDKNIFSHKQVKIAGDEYGLPQTILSLVNEHSVKGVMMKKWIQINYPDDIKKAEKSLK